MVMVLKKKNKEDKRYTTYIIEMVIWMKSWAYTYLFVDKFLCPKLETLASRYAEAAYLLLLIANISKILC